MPSDNDLPKMLGYNSTSPFARTVQKTGSAFTSPFAKGVYTTVGLTAIWVWGVGVGLRACAKR
jgi:hypothetical protein